MRKFFENVVDYPYAILLMIAILSGFGLHILQNKISIERTPNVDAPYVRIHQLYPGASSSEVEQKITRKIEDKLSNIDHIDFVESKSYDGGLEIVIKLFNNDKLEDVKREIEDVLSLVQLEFPKDAEESVVETQSLNDLPILLVSLTNTNETSDLYMLKSFADDLKTKLEGSKDVAHIKIYGNLETEVLIEVDPLRAKVHGFTVDQIAKQVQNEHQNISAGNVESKEKNILIETQGEFADADALKQLKIKRTDGYEIALSQLAKVIRTVRKRKNDTHFNGKPSITLIVRGKDKINIFNAVKDIKTKIDQFKANLPPSITVDTMQDADMDIKTMLSPLTSSVVYYAIFVLILLVIFVGVRNAILFVFAIPLTVLINITLLHFFGFSLNNVSIFGIILTLGFVVSSVIIISESISRHLDEERAPEKAAKRGVSEVGVSLVTTGITIICTFVPLAFMSGIIGDYLLYFPIVIASMIVSSIIIGHFGLPVIIPRLTFSFFNKQALVRTFVDIPAKLTQRFRIQKFETAEEEEDFHKADTKRIEKQVFNTPEPEVTVDDLAMTFSDERVSQKFPELGTFYDETELKNAIAKKYYDEKTTKRFKIDSANVDAKKPVEKPKTKKAEAEAVTFKRIQNVRRWKLDFKGILDESDDLSAALIEQLKIAGDFKEKQNKKSDTNGELIDSFVQAIKNAKVEHDKGLVTSFWRKGEAPEFRVDVKDFQDEKRIIIQPEIDLRQTETSEIKQPVYKTKSSSKKDHDTEKRERDLLTVKASPLVKFLRIKYGIMLNSLIRFRFLIFIIAIIAAFLALFTILSGRINIEYSRNIDRSRFFISIKMPAGTPIKRTSEVVGKIETVISEYIREFQNTGRESYIRSYISTIGDTNALLSDLREYSESGAEYGKIQIELIDIKKRPLTQHEIIQELRQRMPIIPGAHIIVDEIPEKFPTGADISLKVTGEDSTNIYKAASIIRNMIEKIEGIEDIAIDSQFTKPILEISINREKASKFGIDPAELGATIRAAIHGFESGEIVKGENETKIITLLQDSETPDFTRLRLLPVRTKENELIALEEVVDLSYSSTPKAIRHFNNKRSISLRCNLVAGMNTKNIENRITQLIHDDDDLKKLIPEGVNFSFLNENAHRDKFLEELIISIIVGSLLILFVLFVYFNSFRVTFIIVFTIISGFAGVALGLYITNNTLNLMSFIGFLALMLIIINDAVVFVDCIENNRKKGFSLRNSVIRAGQIRLRPTLLISLTILLSLIPLTFNFVENGNFWQLFGIAMIFGILFAILLTLIVIPLAYFELYRREVARQNG